MKLRIIEIEDASEGLIYAALTGLCPAASPVREREASEIATPLAAPVPRQKTEKAPRQALTAPAASAPELRQAPGGGESLATRVLGMLRTKPMSAVELVAALKLPQGSSPVYGAAHTLVKKGLVESRDDDRDGKRRYFLTAGK